MRTTKSWVYDHPDNGLGNFINITPLIKWLFKKTGERVPVYFTHDYIKEVYKDSEMIEVLDEQPENDPAVSSRMKCNFNDKRDYIFNFETITNETYTDDFRPWVPALTTDRNDLKAVLIAGSGSDVRNYLEAKMPGIENYAYIAMKLRSLGYSIVTVGSYQDINRNPALFHLSDQVVLGDINRAITEVATASLVVSNDTGLAHAAGCFDTPLYMLWKYTARPRCENSGLNTQYASEETWLKDFESFLTNYDLRLH